MQHIMVTFSNGKMNLSQIIDADELVVRDDGGLVVLRRGKPIAAFASGVWESAAPCLVSHHLTAAR